MKKLFYILLLLPFLGFSQKNVSTMGLMLKPIVPSNVFRAGDVSMKSDRENLTFQMRQAVGYSFGMVVRIGITENWTFETGINYTKRKFGLTVADSDSSYSEKIDFEVIGYEIPLMALLNIRLDDRVYMNTAFGGSFDLYPSNVGVVAENYVFGGVRNNWMQFALVANVGWEYRTKEKGTWYIGGSYHRPFFPFLGTMIEYTGADYVDKTFSSISGNYLTLDFRYFFHEDPEKRTTFKERKKNKGKSK